MLDKTTLIIILLLILISLHVWVVYKNEYFTTFTGQYFNVDYNTKNVNCDDLTGTNPCVVKTVKPKRKTVCTKKYNFISPTDRIRDMNARAATKNLDKISNSMGGMSLDDLDNIQDDIQSNLNSLDNVDLYNDVVNYNINEQREKKNSDIRNSLNKNKKYIDENTLSDIDRELLSIN